MKLNKLANDSDGVERLSRKLGIILVKAVQQSSMDMNIRKLGAEIRAPLAKHPNLFVRLVNVSDLTRLIRHVTTSTSPIDASDLKDWLKAASSTIQRKRASKVVKKMQGLFIQSLFQQPVWY